MSRRRAVLYGVRGRMSRPRAGSVRAGRPDEVLMRRSVRVGALGGRVLCGALSLRIFPPPVASLPAADFPGQFWRLVKI